MNEWFAVHPGIAFIIIFICLVLIYNKIFRVRKLPVLKNLILYVILAFGSYMLLFFQVDAGLPIIPSLGLAILLMLVVKIRSFFTKRFAKEHREKR